MKRTTIAWTVVLCIASACLGAALIRPNHSAPASESIPCDRPPADRQRQEPTILQARPAGSEGPYLLPHYIHDVEPGKDRTTRISAGQAAR